MRDRSKHESKLIHSCGEPTVTARVLLRAMIVILTLTTSNVRAQQENAPQSQQNAGVRTAPVTLDGRTLFIVRGVTAHPALERARAIASRIAAIAADATFDPGRISIVQRDAATEITANGTMIMSVVNADAALETVDRQALARAYAGRIQLAIGEYRKDRTPAQLRAAAVRSAVVTVVFASSVWLFLFFHKRWMAAGREHYKPRVRSLHVQSFDIVNAQQIWTALEGALRGLRLIVIAVLLYLYLEYVGDLFPWTRSFARGLHDYLSTPLARIWHGAVAQTPNLLFLAILFVVVRYALHMLQLFFAAVAQGTVTLRNFEADWAPPTYRAVRFAVLVLVVVIAYPYIPGSSSDAFKAISLFLGVLLSLGSSSFLSNLIAGYSLTYRRVFRMGDRVKIGEIVGDIIGVRMQVTHVRTVKNEEVIIPNSQILNSEVTNYSSMAHQPGVILHTTVGIGYETPWRQVEAMLLIAAQRTPGVLQQPAPFVLQKMLGDFAITYELNVYCDDEHSMARQYTALHHQILDIFNEYGVQIMTPAYERDPQEPKVVPKQNWHSAPATACSADGHSSSSSAAEPTSSTDEHTSC
jgi:small-conductance mechanosensitive channel